MKNLLKIASAVVFSTNALMAQVGELPVGMTATEKKLGRIMFLQVTGGLPTLQLAQ